MNKRVAWKVLHAEALLIIRFEVVWSVLLIKEVVEMWLAMRTIPRALAILRTGSRRLATQSAQVPTSAGKTPPTLEEFDPLNPGEWQLGVSFHTYSSIIDDAYWRRKALLVDVKH